MRMLMHVMIGLNACLTPRVLQGWAPWPIGLHAAEEEKRRKEEEERKKKEEEKDGDNDTSLPLGPLEKGVPTSSPQQQQQQQQEQQQ
jgi:hypothetical protein